VAEKEPWDSSDEKAKELTADMFGGWEALNEIAKPIRRSLNRKDAKEILRRIAENGPLTSKSGISARLSGSTIGKIVSRDAVNKSSTKAAHYQAIANTDRLFSNAIEPWEFEMNPHKNNQGLRARRYLYAPLEYEGAIITVKFTVKEYQDPFLEKKLYSIEAIQVEIG
jgi:hypothetical protein